MSSQSKPKYTAAQRKAWGARMRKARQTKSKTGRGFYKFWKHPGFSKGVGSTVGAGLGYLINRDPVKGAELGGKFGEWSKSITGFGNYQVQANTILYPTNPRIRNVSELEDATVIRHREYIGDITSSEGFEVQYELPINPGMNESFPWLSGIANNYQQYQIIGMIYEYVPSSGVAVGSTNTALGEVMMACQYDSLETTFVNKQQMLNDNFAQAFAPCTPGLLAIECAPQFTTISKLYTRHHAPPSNADKRLYDLGKITVATHGMQAEDVTLGSLFVNYEIILYKPQLVQELGQLINTCIYNCLSGASASIPLGNTNRVKIHDELGLTFGGSGTQCIIPKNTAGKFIIRWRAVGAATATTVPPVIALTNAAGISIFENETASNTVVQPEEGQTSTQLETATAFQITDPTKTATLTFGTGGTLPTSLTVVEIYLTQIDWDTNL